MEEVVEVEQVEVLKTVSYKCWNGHEGLLLDSANGFDVIACSACDFNHIVPIPTVEALEEVYKDDYYTQEKPLYLEQYQEDLPWWNLVYQERFETFEKELPLARRRILDIGSGPGYFLLNGKKRGWETVGIEPSVRAAEHSQKLGLDVRNKFLTENTASELGLFDAIHMSVVLEHIPEPENFLKLAYSLLRPGGLICVTVPNDYNPIQQALTQTCGYTSWWVAPPHHINYFGFDTLGRLLERTGFDEILRESTFPIDMFLLMGDNYIKNGDLGRVCHTKRKQLETKLVEAGLHDLKRSLYKKFAELDLGREVVIVGKKSDEVT